MRKSTPSHVPGLASPEKASHPERSLEPRWRGESKSRDHYLAGDSSAYGDPSTPQDVSRAKHLVPLTMTRDGFRLRLFGFEEEGTERRQSQAQRKGTAVRGLRLRVHASQVPHAASTVLLGVAIQQLTPESARGHADTVAVARHRSEITDNQNFISRRPALAQKGNNAGGCVIAVHPFETGRISIELVQRGLLPINLVQLRHPVLHPLVHRILQHVPFQAHIVRPLPHLTEFAAHEQHLLARLGVHVTEQQAQIRELLPLVSRHFADERSFAVDYLIV